MTIEKVEVTALVTGVGAIIGQGIIKSLRKSNYSVRVIGIDQSSRSPGPFFCDTFYQKPLCDENSPEYLEFWSDVLKKECVDIVLPGLEADVFFLDSQRHVFDILGISVALNHSKLIAMSSDKWHLYQSLLPVELPRIPSVISETWYEAVAELGNAPLLLKPRNGNGSRGIVKLEDEKDFNYWRLKSGNNWMLQRIVGDDNSEFTVGVFGFGDGEAGKPIVFKRRLSAAGNTLEATVVNDDVITAAADKLTKYFKPLGPTNYQFRKEGNLAYLLEINPRFSSSNSLRTAFGFNEAEMAIDYFKFKNIPQYADVRKGSAWRYSEDFVRYDSDIV